MKNLGLIKGDTGLEEKIEKLSMYPMGELTAYYAKKHGLTQAEAESHELAFLRFMSLSFLTENSLAPDETIDQYWHNFILWTQAYSDFCSTNFGRYVHHSPGHLKINEGELQVAGRLADQLLSEYYGVKLDKDIDRPYKCKRICLIKP
jgi:hypothetical protein